MSDFNIPKLVYSVRPGVVNTFGLSNNHHFVFSLMVTQRLRFLRRWMHPGQTLHQTDTRNSFYNQHLSYDNHAKCSIVPSVLS